MYCKNCGKELKDNDRFCRYCGAAIINEELNTAQSESEQTEQKEEPAQPEPDKLKQKEESPTPEQSSYSTQSEQCSEQAGSKQTLNAESINKGKEKKRNRVIVPIVIGVALMCLFLFVFLNKNSDNPKNVKDAAVEAEVTPSIEPEEATPSNSPKEVAPSTGHEEATISNGPEDSTPPVEPGEATNASYSEDSQQTIVQVDWPKDTVNVVVPYTAGTSMDVCCHALFDRIAEKTGGDFVISCLPGSNGMIAALDFMGKEPDGYSILFNHTAASLVQEAVGRFEYSFTDDFDNCATVAIDRTLVLCAAAPSDNNKGGKFSDFAGMIDYAKAHPGELRYCTVDGSMTEYVGDRLEELAGIEFEDVDVGSDSGNQIKALLNDKVDLTVFYYSSPSVMESIKSGKLICLSVIANERIDGIGAPTLKEQGYDVVSERKLEVKFPKGTDSAIIEYLSGLCKEVTEDPEFAEALKTYYMEPYYRDAATMNAEDPVEVQEYWKYLKD